MVFTWRNLFLFTVITFLRCFCLLVFLTHVFLHYLRFSKNSRAHDDVLHAVNCATPFFFFFFYFFFIFYFLFFIFFYLQGMLIYLQSEKVMACHDSVQDP